MRTAPTNTLRHRAPLLLLGVLLAAAGALRAWMASRNEFPSVDGVMYLDQAFQLIHHGRLPFSCFPPGWPLLAAVPLAFFDADNPSAMLHAAHIANVVLGTLLLGLAYALWRPRLGPWLSLLGVMLLALLPQNIMLAKSDLSEVAFSCGLLASWLAFTRRRYFLAGLLLGYTYLVRPEALLATLGLAAHLAWREKRPPWRLLAGHMIMMTPYLIYIRVASGAWDISSKTVALSQSLDAYPGLDYLGLLAANLKLLLPMVPGLLGWPLTALVVWGLVRARGAWLWMLAPFAPVPFIINPMVTRFWVPYLPFLFLAAGLGVRELCTHLAGRWPRRVLLPTTLALVLVVTAGFGLASRDETLLVYENTEAFYGLKDAGFWLRERITADTVVASYKPYVAYWAGCKFLKYPELNTAVEYVAWARNNGVDYLVVNVRVVVYHRPGLDELMRSPLPERLAADLRLANLFMYEQDYDNTAVYELIRR